MWGWSLSELTLEVLKSYQHSGRRIEEEAAFD
jgi:hypothetical protein